MNTQNMVYKTMKKLSIIFAIVFAALLTSCVGYEPEIELATDNFELQLSKAPGAEEPIYYVRITSNGEWEASLETETGDSWCWFQEYYLDSKGNAVQVVTPVETFEGLDNKWCKVRGTGTVSIPLRYVNAASERHAVIMVRRIDGVDKKCVMFITQK